MTDAQEKIEGRARHLIVERLCDYEEIRVMMPDALRAISREIIADLRDNGIALVNT